MKCLTFICFCWRGLVNLRARRAWIHHLYCIHVHSWFTEALGLHYLQVFLLYHFFGFFIIYQVNIGFSIGLNLEYKIIKLKCFYAHECDTHFIPAPNSATRPNIWYMYTLENWSHLAFLQCCCFEEQGLENSWILRFWLQFPAQISYERIW